MKRSSRALKAAAPCAALILMFAAPPVLANGGGDDDDWDGGRGWTKTDTGNQPYDQEPYENKCVPSDGPIVWYQGTQRTVVMTKGEPDSKHYRYRMTYTASADGTAPGNPAYNQLNVPYDYRHKQTQHLKGPAWMKFYESIRTLREAPPPPPIYRPFGGDDWYITTSYTVNNGVLVPESYKHTDDCRGRSKFDHGDDE